MNTTKPAEQTISQIDAPLKQGTSLSYIGSWFFLTMGTIGLFRGTVNVLGTGGFCAENQPYALAAHCPAGTRESLVVGLLLGAGGLLLGIFGTRGFGVPAHGYAGALLFGSESVALFIAAIRAPGGTSLPLLIVGAICAALAVPALVKPPMRGARSFLGTRRVDGRDRATHGLPARDRLSILLTWVISIVAGGVFALALE